MKKYLGIALSVVLIFGVLAGGYKSFSSKQESSHAQSAEGASSDSKKVTLLTGSAKFGFLTDPALVAILEKEGIQLELVKSGAFESDKLKASHLDAAWPAAANAAADWASVMKSAASFPVFSTPLAIASWKELMPVLEKNGLAKMVGKSYGEFYLDKALPLMVKSARWNQLRDNDSFNFNRGFLVNTPDPRKSNTGALYISTLAYIMNGHEVPQELGKATQLAEELSPLITRQGFQEETLAGPFEDYIGQGKGKAPLVLIYESQFAEAKRNGKLQTRPSALLLYPQPGLILKHVLVGRTEAGKKLGEVLSKNPEVQKIAAQYGFRTNDPAIFSAEMKTNGMDSPELLNLADAPSTTILDSMNQTIIKKLEGK